MHHEIRSFKPFAGAADEQDDVRVREQKTLPHVAKGKVGCTASDASGVWTVFKAVSLSILRRLASDK